MKKIILPPMEEKVKDLIKILGIGLNEIIIELPMGSITFDSIEWSDEEDKVILHKFEDDLDYSFDFSDLTSEQQEKVFRILSVIYN